MGNISTEKREAVSRRLKELEDAKGRVTAEDVVADAKDQDSPFHDMFEWDVAKAAHEHWLARAREIITMRVVVVNETSRISVVGYVRDPSAGPHEQGYVSVARLRTDADSAREVLVNEFSRIRDMLNRARELAVVFGIEKEVGDMVTKVVGLRTQVIQSDNTLQ